MKIATNTYLKYIPFSEINFWDVKRYYSLNNLQFNNVVTLRDILIPYRKAISKEEMIKNKWQIIAKINFGGDLFLRDFEEINTYKGSLNLVPDNSIIYSKINVRHGCIYFHDKDKTPFAVSSEYPTYQFDENIINGKFLHKILRSNAFKKLLNTKTTGISKARVKQDEFLDIQIPLPPIEEQELLIKTYFDKIKEAEQLQNEAKDLEDEIEKYMFSELRINDHKNRIFKTGLNLIDYNHLTKWSLNSIYKNETYNFEYSGYKTEKIANLLTFFEGGKTPSKSQNDYWNGEIFWTSPKDFKGQDIIEKAEDKISQLAVKETGIKVYPSGVFLSVFRSGILQHSFPTAITKIETAINQDLKAYSLNENLIDNYYYLHFVHVFKKHILSIASKKSVTVESINTEDFLEIKIPLPPLSKQKEIAQNINNFKIKISDLKKLAIEYITEAQQQFEQSIFN